MRPQGHPGERSVAPNVRAVADEGGGLGSFRVRETPGERDPQPFGGVGLGARREGHHGVAHGRIGQQDGEFGKLGGEQLGAVVVPGDVGQHGLEFLTVGAVAAAGADGEFVGEVTRVDRLVDVVGNLHAPGHRQRGEQIGEFGAGPPDRPALEDAGGGDGRGLRVRDRPARTADERKPCSAASDLGNGVCSGDANPAPVEADGEVVEQSAGRGDGGGVGVVETVVDEDDEHGVGALPIAERTESVEDVAHRSRHRIVLAGRQDQVVAHDGADGRGPGTVAPAAGIGREAQHDQRPCGQEAEHGRHGGDQIPGSVSRSGRGEEVDVVMRRLSPTTGALGGRATRIRGIWGRALRLWTSTAAAGVPAARCRCRLVACRVSRRARAPRSPRTPGPGWRCRRAPHRRTCTSPAPARRRPGRSGWSSTG